MTKQSLQAFKRTVTVAWPKHRDDAAKELLLRTAREGHAKTMQEQTSRGGIAPTFTAYANTPGNSNLETVKLPGPIVYRYSYFREVVFTAIGWLEANSPVEKGDYRRGHTVFLNGVALDSAIDGEYAPGDDIMIVNTVPYARKLEVGKTESGRDFLISVPNRIYERASNALSKRFGNLAKIHVEFVRVSNAYTLKQDQQSRRMKDGRWKYDRKQRRDRVAGSEVTYPALIISSR